jgi:hypothetical protein
MSGVPVPPRPRSGPALRAAALCAAAALVAAGAWAAPPVPASSAHPAGTSPRDVGGPRWNELTPAQRQVLAPLANEWNSIDDRSKERWLGVAGRFHKLPPEEQQRATQRMAEWSRMTPQERTQARLNFQESRTVPKAERQARWEQYQALSEEQKRELARRAAAPAPANGASSGTGTTARHRHSTPVEVVQPKTNVVSPIKESRTPIEPGSVSVEVRPGATTTLLNRRATPPAHQREGQPKIAAGPNVVDHTTLLPKHAAPAAGSGPAPAPPRPRSEAPDGVPRQP